MRARHRISSVRRFPRPAHDPLIHEDGFDAGSAAGKRVLEFRPGQAESVRALPAHDPGALLVASSQPDSLELALVPVAHLSILQGDEQAVVRVPVLALGRPDQRSCHAEM